MKKIRERKTKVYYVVREVECYFCETKDSKFNTSNHIHFRISDVRDNPCIPDKYMCERCYNTYYRDFFRMQKRETTKLFAEQEANAKKNLTRRLKELGR
ncbi:MAG: hypothetical protein DRR06_19885 [Gammaproteobacteria bacterium]|nr:MAG: hypothetical protein DRR06_19885 [Gammaproteobacteria bacterium]